MCFTDGNGCGSAGASAVADAVLYPTQSDRRVPPRSSNRGVARSDSAFARRAPPAAIFLIFNYPQNQFSTQEKQLGAEEKFVEVGIQFGILFVIDTSTKSPWILKYSNNSESILS
jgi:hypothetical protein